MLVVAREAKFQSASEYWVHFLLVSRCLFCGIEVAKVSFFGIEISFWYRDLCFLLFSI